MRFDIEDNRYVVKDTFLNAEVDSIKYYLIQTSISDITISFRFDTHILSNTIIEIYQEPTLTSNGRLLNGIITLNIYADPIVITEGTKIHDIDTYDLASIDADIVGLLAETTYLMKIIPKDLNNTIIS